MITKHCQTPINRFGSVIVSDHLEYSTPLTVIDTILSVLTSQLNQELNDPISTPEEITHPALLYN